MDGDIALEWVNNHGEMAITDDGDLATDAGLETPVIISLFTDNRAGDDDELPATETDRRGWWGGEIGSKLWLLRREKQMQSVVRRAEEYARAALTWMTADGVAKRVTVTGSIPRTGWLWLDIHIYRPDGREFARKYEYAWESQKYRRLA